MKDAFLRAGPSAFAREGPKTKKRRQKRILYMTT
jgi:hypothetical protein